VQPSVPNAPARPIRARGSGGRRRLVALALLGLWATAGVLAAAAPAAADPSPTADPAPPVSIDLTVPAFSPSNAVPVSGKRTPGHSIEVATESSSTACTVPASPPTETWSCTIALPNGAARTVTATEKDDDGDVVGEPESANVDVLGVPTIDGSSGFLTTGIVSGSGFPGSVVTVAVSGGAQPGCSSQPIGSNGYWSCSLGAGSGRWTIQARQANSGIGGGSPSLPSGSLAVVVDKDAPAPPTITSPRAGSRVTSSVVTYTGRGEPGATVGLYIDNTPSCTAIVDGAGAWSCRVRGTGNGIHRVLAIQSDAAGNYGSPSAAISLAFGPASSPAPGSGESPPQGTPTPAPSTQPPGPTAPTLPAPPSGGGTPGTSWGTPTGFGSGLPTPAESLARGNWWLAPALAVAFLVLVAVPLRLAASALRGRRIAPLARLFGRNRVSAEEDGSVAAGPGNPWLTAAVPLAAAAVFIVLAGGVNDELRYLRLTAAVGLALALLNLLGVAVAGGLAGRALGAGGRLRFLPVLLLAAALTALLSRVTGMDPPLLAGVIIGLGIPAAVPPRRSALARLSEVGAVAGIAVVAWLLHASPLGSGEGFWGRLLAEGLGTLTLAGLGSALIMVLPLGPLPGAALLRWSKAAWAATVLVVGILACGILLGDTGSRLPVLAALGVAAAIGAISVAIWSWTRFVEPARR